jgi:hypothetical protein
VRLLKDLGAQRLPEDFPGVQLDHPFAGPNRTGITGEVLQH